MLSRIEITNLRVNEPTDGTIRSERYSAIAFSTLRTTSIGIVRLLIDPGVNCPGILA
jgi:hypothetical protein